MTVRTDSIRRTTIQSVRLPAHLARGEQGPAVKRLQQLLDKRGISPGPLDGLFGPKTERAVRAFQRRAGLEVDGVVGEKTWTKLFAADGARSKADQVGNALVAEHLATAPIRLGDADKATAFAKRMLRTAGHDAGSGVGFDARAVLALEAFQQARGLPVTGELEAASFSALREVQRRARRSGGQAFGLGQKGDKVLRAEQQLRHLGYGVGKVDGVFDADTAGAVKAYRADQLRGRRDGPVSGTLSEGLRGKLKSEVKATERLLQAVGFKRVRADGVVDGATTKALRAFEKKHQLGVDGEISGKDLKKLQSEAARLNGGQRAFDIAKRYLGWNASQIKVSGNEVGRAMFDWVPNNVNCANFVSGVLVAAGQLNRSQVNASVYGLMGVLDRDPQFQRVGSLKNAKPGDVVSMKTPSSEHVVMFAGWRNGRPLFIGSNNVNADGSQRISWTQPGYPILAIHRYRG
jgi:peptidoglycan hydrolase-like protein with peptidoglycan-binding domain